MTEDSPANALEMVLSFPALPDGFYRSKPSDGTPAAGTIGHTPLATVTPGLEGRFSGSVLEFRGVASSSFWVDRCLPLLALRHSGESRNPGWSSAVDPGLPVEGLTVIPLDRSCFGWRGVAATPPRCDALRPSKDWVHLRAPRFQLLSDSKTPSPVCGERVAKGRVRGQEPTEPRPSGV